MPVAQGSNEIPAACDLLTHVSLTDKTVLADALHTQVATAQQILYEGGGGDYVLSVKANQKELVQIIEKLLTPGKSPPQPTPADPGATPGAQPQTA